MLSTFNALLPLTQLMPYGLVGESPRSADGEGTILDMVPGWTTICWCEAKMDYRCLVPPSQG